MKKLKVYKCKVCNIETTNPKKICPLCLMQKVLTNVK